MSQRGFSLIEVVAALAILGSATIVLLRSHSQSVHQLAIMRQRQQAAELAGELLAMWRLEEEDLTVPTHGACEAHPKWSWSRQVEEVYTAGLDRMKLITLTILRTTDTGETLAVAGYPWLETPDETAR